MHISKPEYSDRINITHWYPKIGWGGKLNDIIKQMKKVWQASGESVAVYTASSSGPAQYILVGRYSRD